VRAGRELRAFAAALAGWALAVLPGCVAGPQGGDAGPADAALVRVERAGEHMGTRFRVVLYAPERAAGERAADAALARVAELDARLSDWRPESELSRLGAASDGRAPTPPIPISTDLATVLARALAVARASDGAFDPTVGPLVRLWRRSRRQGRLPLPEQLAAARTRTGFTHLAVDAEGRTACLAVSGMRLDLGGIAKGWAADEALALLAARGIDRALVDAGGDVVCGAPPPGRAGWRVEVRPFPGAPRPDDPAPQPGDPGPAEPVRLELARAAVATSGDRFQWVEIDGRRYAHLVDPATGLGLERSVAATVVARDGATADAWASAVCVAGPERGLALARAAGVEVRACAVVDGAWRVAATEGFAAHVVDSAPPAPRTSAPPAPAPPRAPSRSP
jgi:thiamine biosynthesis lipoprotein